MSAALLHELGMRTLVAGTVALWAVVALRVPGAVWSIPQRRLLTAVAGLAGSITVYLDPVTAVLSRTAVASSCGIAMNVWGVLSSAFILDFVLAALTKRRPWLVYGSGATVSGALILLNLADGGGQAGCVTSDHVPWYSPFWWLLSIAHLVAVIPITVLCARQSRAIGNPQVRIGLALLAAGFASSTVFWSVVVLGYLVTGAGWLGSLFALNVGVTAWLVTAGVGLPLLTQSYRRGRQLRTLWQLRPLWRQVVASVPQVRMPKPTVGSVARWSTRLRLYRRVIEIRDALLVLRGHVSRQTVEAAHAYVRAAAPGSEPEPLATACWLAVARESRSRGTPICRAPAAPPAQRPAGDAWTAEIAFQTALARVQDAPLVGNFGLIHAGGGQSAPAPANQKGSR